MGVIHWSAKKPIGRRCEAWADVSVFEVPYEGADDLSAIDRAVRVKHPAASSYGALRWFGGASAVSIDPGRKVVVVEERECLCD